MLTQGQRRALAENVISAMRVHYKSVGEDGDFDDGFRYLANDASDGELQEEYSRWCNLQPAI